MAKVHFTKTYKQPSDLVSLLQGRNLVISDRTRAERYIESIGYYRLSAYMYPFLLTPKSNHVFKAGTNFEQIIRLYCFDKKLRVLLFNEIEKIEIAIREAVMNMASDRTGDIYWLTNHIHFHDQNIFHNSRDLLKKEYDRSTEDFIEHFKSTYLESYPPAWILGELLPMGNVNIYYRNLKDKTLKKRIAKRFCLHAPVFESWLSVLTLTRNACCHHSRVWNKVNKIIPNDMRGMTRPWITLPSDKRRIYYNICIIKYFRDIISPNNDMLAKLRWLFVDFPEIDLKALGFPLGWEMEPLWQ
ncbi:MAG: Abi family protein [Sodaliphilus sp.]|nr:Abi family protein [Sodaliphilus sp.]